MYAGKTVFAQIKNRQGLGLEFDIVHSLDAGPKLRVLPVTGAR
jgi:hypothetical protein